MYFHRPNKNCYLCQKTGTYPLSVIYLNASHEYNAIFESLDNISFQTQVHVDKK